MTNNDDLLPCPFCMSDKVSIGSGISDRPMLGLTETFVHCRSCGAKGPIVRTTSEYDIERAKTMWNTLNAPKKLGESTASQSQTESIGS